MKTRIILIGSLALNCALAGAAWFLFHQPQGALIPEARDATKPSTPTNAGVKASMPVRDLGTNALETAGDYAWRAVQAKDFRTYIDNLRLVDCPEETIRDIITAEINKLFAKRLRNIRQANEPEYKYWQTGRNNWDPKKYYELQKRVRAVEKEKTALLVELLGTDPNAELKKEFQQFDFFERDIEFLPEEKRDQAAEIQVRFSQLEQEIYRAGVMDDEDQKKIRELYKQRLAELAKILTPGELAEYELRASQVASQLRHDLDLFTPSEDEFRKIFAIRKPREEDLAYTFDQEDKAAQKRRELAVIETDEQVKAILGEDRFKLYKRAPDWNYRELVKLVDGQQLPRENVDKVYDMKTETEKAANELRTNSEYTPAQKKEMLKQIREDAQKTIIEALGQKGWKKYNERQGWWLNNISPQERKTP